MPRFAAWSAERARAIIDDYRDTSGALLPALHALLVEFGHIAPEAIPLLAEALTLSRADVQGVITFYHDFRTTPPGRHLVKLCRAEACQSMGSASLEDHARHHLAIGWGETTEDGEFTLEPVFCLGNCALSPAVMVDGELYGRVSPERFDAILASAGQSTAAPEQTP
ncbi:formate dehydrogenase subunit gamma [Telmatospirillum siberiense]|uniref:Formate dehydrogenase subunit gamma n=1 Tax=Telmatospirillum siberiense TaxID=382514 RepID=A0A2N3PYX2_9PROT|nr:formate dehydrogenase subunit gamma [Telmatospirillum siberiense]PKU25603.1 formate dehydrogenase subunit gamma [Telmatospirillum siberiense]